MTHHSRSSRAWSCLALALWMLATPRLASQQPRPAAVGTATVSGRVVSDADGRTALARVSVLLHVASSSGPVREAVTDSDGRYAFPRFPAGTCEIRASLPGWLMSSYGQKKPDRAGTPVVVAEGQNVGDLTIRLFRGSVLTGAVRGVNGQPIVGGSVVAYRVRFRPDGRYLAEAGTSPTDDRGHFRIFGLAPAEYLLRVVPQGSNRVAVPQAAILDSAQGLRADGYVPTFYPAAASPAQAAVIAPGPAEERTNLDFDLPIVPFSTIRGRVVGPDGPVSVSRLSRLDDDGWLSAEPLRFAGGADGEFLLTELPAGPLTVHARAHSANKELTGIARLVAGGGQVSGVTVAVQPGATVSGVVRTALGAPALDPSSGVMIGLQSAEIALSQPLRTSRVQPNGEFAIGDVPRGRYYLVLVTISQSRRWSVVSATADKLDVTASALDVGSSDVTDVEVTVGDRQASLSGALQVPAGVTATEYTVIAFPADPRLRAARPRAVFAVRPNTDGRFVLSWVFPGNYLLSVVEDIEPDAWYDPRVLERLAAANPMRVTIPPGEAVVQDLQIARREPRMRALTAGARRGRVH